MSRRTTRCLTWGEARRSGETVRGQDGRWIAHLSFLSYVTLCGRPEDLNAEPRLAGEDDPNGRRPGGTCRSCWPIYRDEMRRAMHAPLEPGP